MGEDYKRASLDTVYLFRDKPFRMTAYVTMAVATTYMYKNNPSMDDYETHLATMTADIAEVGADIRDNAKCKQVQQITHHHTHDRLKRFTFGVCSVIWISDYPAYVDLYEAKDKNVKMTWSEWPNYIIDVGFLGRWRWSEKFMEDFDINPEEWKHLEEAKIGA